MDRIVKNVWIIMIISVISIVSVFASYNQVDTSQHEYINMSIRILGLRERSYLALVFYDEIPQKQDVLHYDNIIYIVNGSENPPEETKTSFSVPLSSSFTGYMGFLFHTPNSTYEYIGATLYEINDNNGNEFEYIFNDIILQGNDDIMTVVQNNNQLYEFFSDGVEEDVFAFIPINHSIDYPQGGNVIKMKMNGTFIDVNRYVKTGGVFT